MLNHFRARRSLAFWSKRWQVLFLGILLFGCTGLDPRFTGGAKNDSSPNQDQADKTKSPIPFVNATCGGAPCIK